MFTLSLFFFSPSGWLSGPGKMPSCVSKKRFFLFFSSNLEVRFKMKAPIFVYSYFRSALAPGALCRSSGPGKRRTACDKTSVFGEHKVKKAGRLHGDPEG